MDNFNKKKLVILDFDDIKNPLLNAGQARATLEIGSRLAKKGYDIKVISSRYPNCQDRFEHGIYYLHIGLGSKFIRLNNLIYIFVLPFYVRKIKADLILECFTGPISTLFSPLWTKIPVIAIPTSFDAQRHAKQYHLPFQIIEKYGCSFYKYFLPYTEAIDRKMKSINPKVISKIVPEGVSDEYLKIKKKNPKHILYLGRYNIDQKGIDLLLQAFAKVAKQIPYPLIMAGHGPDVDKIQQLIKSLKLKKNIHFTGSAYGNKKKRLLSEALFVVFPSRNEGFPLFALEALAAGLPIISFDIPALSWLDKNVSLKAKPYNIKEYSKLLLKASTSPSLIEKMGNNSRKLAKNYTWDNVVNKYESFFQSVLKILPEL
jgi:glycogen synthase